MKLQTKKRKGLNGEMVGGKIKKVKQLQSYYFQGGKWYKVKPVRGLL